METIQTIFKVFATFALPLIVVGFPLYGLLRKVNVYEEFVTGAKEGFNVSVRIIPYLVAILFAIGMFRASGAMQYLMDWLSKPLALVGFPAELVPMAIVRPLSGSGSVAVLADMIRTHGIDSIYVKMAATIFGSTETTFYVLAVYFGSVGVRKTRHAVAAGLIAELAAVILGVYVIKLLFPGG
jgi:spore maturation protein B